MDRSVGYLQDIVRGEVLPVPIGENGTLEFDKNKFRRVFPVMNRKTGDFEYVLEVNPTLHDQQIVVRPLVPVEVRDDKGKVISTTLEPLAGQTVAIWSDEFDESKHQLARPEGVAQNVVSPFSIIGKDEDDD